MNPQVKDYLKRCFSSSRSVFAALAVALAFALVNIFGEMGRERDINFLQSMITPLIFAFAVFINVWTAHCFFHGVLLWIRLKFARTIHYGLGISFVVSFIGMSAGLILARYLSALYEHQPFSLENMGGAFLIGTFITLMFLFYYSYKNSREENLKLQALNAENELNVLKKQMQPHFLFNTLNGLSELIASDPEHASVMTQMLADLYREILQSSKSKTIRLSDEISLVEKYIKLEQCRFGQRLNYKISLCNEEVYLPPLVIQTLAENALKHGISPSLDGGTVDINVSARSGGYQVTVKNTGGPLIIGKNGTGIANTIARLKLLYGERHGFSLTGGAETIATFWITGEKID